ncbi:transcription factor SKN7-like [Hyaena hyaena]|uniref:transcription factor SKN7-like n=1 Tax=Hyaena hyaena TaxID=95912 RepID=UPI0019231B62|nr:transcription factor SKN7-like [Hyaena hyaena]
MKPPVWEPVNEGFLCTKPQEPPNRPAPRGTRASAPSLGALQRDASPSGPLTSHRQLRAGTGLTAAAAAAAAAAAELAPGLWLMVGPPHPTQKRYFDKEDGAVLIQPSGPPGQEWCR